MAAPRHANAADTPAERYYVEYARARKRLVVPFTLIIIGTFFLLPLLTNFTSALDGVAFSGITWAYLYAFAVFALVLIITTTYRRAMDKFEHTHRPPADVHPADEYDDV
jgi:uncharacterized membrane protein (DUF485 family)